VKSDVRLVVKDGHPEALEVDGVVLQDVMRLVFTQEVRGLPALEIELLPRGFEFQGPAEVYFSTAGLADLLADAATEDAAHHKTWYVEQIAKALHIELPEHEAGIAP